MLGRRSFFTAGVAGYIASIVVCVSKRRYFLGLCVCAVVRTSEGLCTNGGASRIGRYNAAIPCVRILVDRYVLGLGMFAVVRTSLGFCANGGASRIGRYCALVPSVCVLIDSYLLGIDMRYIILANVGHLAHRRAGVIYSQFTHVVMSEWLAAFRNDAAG